MKKTVMGFAIAGFAFIFIIGAFAIALGPQLTKWGWSSAKNYVDKKADEDRTFHKILDQWVPPGPDGTADDLFPGTILQFKKASVDRNAEIKEIALKRTGFHSVYRNEEQSIDLFAYSVSSKEWDEIKGDAEKAITGTKNHSWVCFGSSCTLNWFKNEPSLHLQWNKDWLYVIRAMDLDGTETFISELYGITGRQAAQKESTTSDDSLITAVKKQDWQRVYQMLDSGADPNSKDKEGTPLLILAIQTYKLEAVQSVLGAGADPDGRNAKGQTSLMLVCADENLDHGQYRFDVFTMLYEAGANIYLKDQSGKTSLMYAALAGKSAMISRLIDYGADITTKDKDGKTTLNFVDQEELNKLKAAAELPQVESFEAWPASGEVIQGSRHRSRRPGLQRFVRPNYPDEALANNLSGTVILEGLFDAGKIVNLKVRKSANPILDESAKNTVSQWVIFPAVINDEGISTRFTTAIRYETKSILKETADNTGSLNESQLLEDAEASFHYDEYARAADLYQKALNRNPDLRGRVQGKIAKCYYNLGLLSLRRRDCASASGHFRDVLALDKSDSASAKALSITLRCSKVGFAAILDDIQNLEFLK